MISFHLIANVTLNLSIYNILPYVSYLTVSYPYK